MSEEAKQSARRGESSFCVPRAAIEALLSARRDALQQAALEAQLAAEALDVTLPGRRAGSGGLHPVVALYATFVNRAFDQVLMDVALHKAGVTFVLDRAGVTGPDGASHHGMWDLAILQVVPNIRIAAPRDATRLREELGEAVAVDDAPTVVRFSKGSVGIEYETIRRTDDGVDVLREAPHKDVLIVTVGPMAKIGLQVAERLAAQGIGATVIDPRWVVPVPASVITFAWKFRAYSTPPG